MSDQQYDGVEAVRAERLSQIAKGWTPEHDDTHTNGELAAFASLLLWATIEGYDGLNDDPESYGVSEAWIVRATDHALVKHPEVPDRLRIVAALIVAEMERHQRLAPPDSPAVPTPTESGHE